MKRILLNSFGKSILCLLAALLSGGTTWAAEEVYKTARFAQAYSSKQVDDYNSTWTSTYDDLPLTIVNWKNHGSKGWYDYIATGDNGQALVATVTTVNPIDAAITKVSVDFTELISSSINSIKLFTSTDGSNWDLVDNFAKEQTVVTVNISSPAENLYYRIEADCANGNATGGANKSNFLKIQKIEFYHENMSLVQAPVISGQQIFEANTTTTVTITCPEPDADATLQYSIDHGYNWVDYEGPFSLDKTTTVIAKASKSGMQDNQTSKVFTLAVDAEHFDWNLARAEYATSSTTEVTWTSDDATMTLAKNTSDQNANAYLGGNGGNTNTGFYKNQTLTISPQKDYTIQKVIIHTSTNAYATAGFSRTWENATFSISGTEITVTPNIGTEPISVGIANETHILAVDVDCSPASSPYVTATGHQTVISGTSSGTFDVYYNRLESNTAEVILCDANGNAATYDWIEVELDDNDDIAFTVTKQNPSTTERTAYAILSVEKDDDHYYTPVIAVTQEAPIPVTISAVGYSTLYYGKKNLIVPEGVTAATYNVVDGKLTQSSTYDVIPAGSGVVLSGSQDTYYFYESLTADAKDGNNLLRGSDEEAQTTGGTYYYALTLNASSDPKSVGFYWMTANGGKFTNGAHKAYLALDTMFAEPASGVKSYFTLLDNDDPTGIDNVDANVNLNDDTIYNVAGQRLSKMQKGINIINGKKILK